MVGTAGATVVACGNEKPSEAIPEVSKQELVASVYQARELITKNKNVNPVAEAKLELLIADAQRVVDNVDADQTEVDTAKGTLDQGIKEFQDAIKTDYSELEAVIKEAQEAIANNKNPNADAEKTLTEAIIAAQKIIIDNESSQTKVNDEVIPNLKSAIEEFQKATATDFSELKATIVKAEEIKANPKNHNEEAEKALTEAIGSAQKMVEEAKASQEEVTEVVEELEQTIEVFQELTSTDFSELEETITKANEVKENPKNYNEEAEKTLEAAISDAQKVIDEAQATQEEVSAEIEKLEVAIETFQKATATDKSQLILTIEAAQKALDENENPNANEEVLAAAIKYAEDINADPEVTQEVVDTVVNVLKTALEVFEQERTIQTDYSILEATITAAENAITTNKNPNEEAALKLQKIINVAKGVLEEHHSSQIVVNDNVKLLNKGIEKFQDATKTVYTDLETAINNANKAIVESKNYKPEAENILKTAIVLAKEILNSEEASQVQVDNAVASLNTAIEKFQEATKTDFQELQIAIEFAEKALEKYKNNPNAEIARFKNAIQSAKNVVNDKEATQVKVDEAKAILEWETRYFIHTPLTDFEELTTTLQEAETALRENLNPNANILNLEKAIRIAEKVALDKDATQVKVDETTSTLKKAINDFVNTKQTDYRELKLTINEAETVFEKYKNNPNADIERFTSAIQKAKEIFESVVPQARVDLEVFLLKLEIRDFKGTPATDLDNLIVVIKEARTAIEENKNPNAEKWESDLFLTVKDAEKLILNKEVSQTEVDEMTSTLKEKLEIYKNIPTTDFSKLKEKLDEAKAALEKYKDVSSDFKKKDRLEQAVKESEKALADEKTLQEDADDLADLLNQWTKSFVESVEKSESEELYL